MDGREPKHVTTTNHFLTSGYPGANGVKTGFTNAAGECLVASATRDGHTLVLVLYNDDNRWTDAPTIFRLRLSGDCRRGNSLTGSATTGV